MSGALVALLALIRKRQVRAIVVRGAKELHDRKERIHLHEAGFGTETNEHAPLPNDQVVPDGETTIDIRNAENGRLMILSHPIPLHDIERVHCRQVGVVIPPEIAGQLFVVCSEEMRDTVGLIGSQVRQGAEHPPAFADGTVIGAKLRRQEHLLLAAVG
jgi:hypothetical protein